HGAENLGAVNRLSRVRGAERTAERGIKWRVPKEAAHHVAKKNGDEPTDKEDGDRRQDIRDIGEHRVYRPGEPAHGLLSFRPGRRPSRRSWVACSGQLSI